MPKKLTGLIFIIATLGLLLAALIYRPLSNSPPKPASSATQTKAAATHTASDWLIEPGSRIGPITATSTLADLQQWFGPGNVKVSPIPGPEGTTFEGVYVYPNEPSKTLALIWKEGSHPQTVAIAQLSGTQSLWYTQEGVSLGTRLRTLEQLNQGAFTLSGFDWDYGGTVLSWGDSGKLRPRFQQNGSLVVRLSLPPEASSPAHQKAALQVAGDQTFSSSHPAMQTLNPLVTQIQIILQ
ncbi:hypothetical protein [Vampirovibrio sp.]|uniref:hypothetical protein n=1 Tax=Vampirovibrio sp. TaxID=2717857 RepID=UPI00359466D2